MFDKSISRKNFNASVESYDVAAVLQREVAKRLSQRLDYIKIQPNRALDLGCGTGIVSQDLLSRYPKSKVIGLDSAFNRAKKCQKRGGWLRKPRVICADAESLPIKDDAFELVVSNLMLNWVDDFSGAFSEIQRVLAPNGLLLFSMFGPDTLNEIRQCWSDVDTFPHTHDFADMHEVGDALLQSGFINPVMDMEIITMTYTDVMQLMQDLKNTGFSNTHQERQKGLMGKHKFKVFEEAYEQFKTAEGLYPATWEVIYGHAWVGEGIKFDNYENVIPIMPVD